MSQIAKRSIAIRNHKQASALRTNFGRASAKSLWRKAQT